MFQDPMNSAFDIYRMMATAAETFSRYAWNNPTQARSAPVDNTQRMFRLYMAFVNSGYRYLARWAEISSKRYPELARALTAINAGRAVSDEELGALTDSFRAYLREMAELPVEESKRLQDEIEDIMSGEAATGYPGQDYYPGQGYPGESATGYPSGSPKRQHGKAPEGRSRKSQPKRRARAKS